MNEANQITETTALYGFIAEEAQQNRFAAVLNKQFKAAGDDAMMIPMNIRPDDFYFTLANMKKSKVSGAVIGSEYQQEAVELLDTADDEVQKCGICDMVFVRDNRLEGSLITGRSLASYLTTAGAKKIAVIGTGPQARSLALNGSGLQLHVFDANIEAIMQMSSELGVSQIDINRCAEGMEVDLGGFDAVVVCDGIEDLAMVTALPGRCIDLKRAKQPSVLRSRCRELGTEYSGYEALLDTMVQCTYERFKPTKE